MEFIAAVAIGLNPYAGVLLLAALGAFTTHVPQGELSAIFSGPTMASVAVAFGLALPVDIALGKFVRFAPTVRRVSQFVAPAAAALAAVSVTESDLPSGLVAVASAATAWAVAAMLTGVAARASRSAAWIGLGHIPVLMAAATASACIVPLGLASRGIGYSLAAIAVVTLAWATASAMRHSSIARRAPRRATSLAGRRSNR
ncbi:MAG: hypothetical protein HY332_22795 [Chloroflexi bacterium]|nr:hypothetical protein [Chloroflexota bacterium]